MAAALITDELYARLLANGARSAAGEDIDPRPVVKLFTPDAGATWLLTEADPQDPDRLFGLCDLGVGEPELGYVSLAEIRTVRGRLRLPVERDLHFRAEHPLSWYTQRARQSAGSSPTDDRNRAPPSDGALRRAHEERRRSGCSAFWFYGFVHPDPVIIPGARLRSCWAGCLGALPPGAMQGIADARPGRFPRPSARMRVSDSRP